MLKKIKISLLVLFMITGNSSAMAAGLADIMFKDLFKNLPDTVAPLSPEDDPNNEEDVPEKEKTLEEYWDETDLTLEVFNSYFNSVDATGCSKSAIYFKGCVAGLNAFLSELQQTLIPVSLAQDPDFNAAAIVKSYGPMAIYKLSASKDEASAELQKLNARERWEKQKSQRDKLDQAYQSILSQLSEQNYLAKIFDEQQKQWEQAIPQNRYKFIIATAFNEFRTSSYDAHGHIDAYEKVAKDQSSADKSFSGIGVELQSDVLLTIVRVIEGGPAEKMGLLAGDIIDQVDHKPVKGIKIDDVVAKMIKGPPGTEVIITIIRGGVSQDFKIIRAPIKVEGVVGNIINDFGLPLGYLRVSQFMGNDLCTQLKSKVTQMNPNVKGFVLDLRNNPGGAVKLAVCIAGVFVGKKEITKMKDLITGNFLQPEVSQEDQLTQLPLVVMLNSGSASASELVSGALRDYERALIVGVRSFGKGSVQTGQPADKTGLLPKDLLGTVMDFHTTNYFYQPGGTTNQVVGIGVDFQAEIKPDATEDEKFFVREEQLFPNALKPDGSAWTASAAQQKLVGEIQGCRNNQQWAEKKYTETKSPQQPKTIYQLYVAEEVLACQLNSPVSVQIK